MVVMARLSRPERPDPVFVSLLRGKGWLVWGHRGFDAAGGQGLAPRGSRPQLCRPEGGRTLMGQRPYGDVPVRLARSKGLVPEPRGPEQRTAVEVKALASRARSGNGSGRGGKFE